MTTRSNLYVDQGVDFAVTLDLFDSEGIDFNITDQEFFCQVRKLYSSALAFEGIVTINTDDNDENNIDILFPAESTLDKEPGKYQYDVIMRTDTGSEKILEGIIFLLPTITRVQ